jgi:membrane associated rhomboid family serine protease
MDITEKKFIEALRFPLYLLIALWGVFLFQEMFHAQLGFLGVYPRALDGLTGILTGPFIHADLKHIVSNSIPLAAMLAIILFFYPSIALRSFWMIYVFTGICVWIFAREIYHIGISGVVYGLVSFVFWTGIFRRNMKSVVLGLLVLTTYSGMIAGLSPNQTGISWESHLLGAIVGIFTSYYFKDDIEEDEMPTPNPFADEPAYADRPYFLPRDAFDLTKIERQQLEEERLRQEEAARQQAILEERQRRYDAWVSSNSWENNNEI